MGVYLIIELDKDNDDRLIELSNSLYCEMMNGNDLTDNMSHKLVIKKEKEYFNFLSFCFIDNDFFYSDYHYFEEALYKLLDDNNLYYRKRKNQKNISIEVNYGNSTNSIVIPNNFGIHEDTDSVLLGYSYTVIIYVNTKCSEGELIFYENNNNNYDIIKVIDINPNTETSTKIVIFDGEILHKPQNFHSGRRCAFVCQILK